MQFILCALLTTFSLVNLRIEAANMPEKAHKMQDISVFCPNSLYDPCKYSVTTYLGMVDQIRNELDKIGYCTSCFTDLDAGALNPNVLHLQVFPVYDSIEQKTDRVLLKLSLQICAFPTLQIYTYPFDPIFSVCGDIFCADSIVSDDEESVLKGIRKLLRKFNRFYTDANGDQIEKPIFYIYY